MSHIPVVDYRELSTNREKFLSDLRHALADVGFMVLLRMPSLSLSRTQSRTHTTYLTRTHTTLHRCWPTTLHSKTGFSKQCSKSECCPASILLLNCTFC